MVYARVHEGAPIPKPKPAESSFARLDETVRALEVNALARATVTVTGIPGTSTATADDHGFIALPVPGGFSSGHVRVGLQVTTPGWTSAPADLEIPVWDDHPDLGVISDIDDTLTDTGVTHKAKALLGTFFHSEYEVRIFPGSPDVVANAARICPGCAGRALFYLSGSPWGLHERIQDAFARAGLPRGAMILRRYSTEPIDPFRFKHPHLQALFDAFPHHRWILFGDNGEKDPEVYRQMRLERPAQIERIYIHNVTAADPNDPRFEGMTVFTNWSDIAPTVP